MDKIVQTVKRFSARYTTFTSEIAKTRIMYRTGLKYKTAATNCKDTIYIDPDYFENLVDLEDRLFLLAHEFMHIKLKHGSRRGDRDPDLWNTVCDAIINANLEKDGFHVPEECVMIEGALKYSAEELYDKLLAEGYKCDKEQENKNQFRDDHDVWNEDPELADDSTKKIDDAKEFEKARNERKERIKRKRNQISNNYEKAVEKLSSTREKVGEVGEAEAVVDWKDLLSAEINTGDQLDVRWSRRRSIKANNYALRLTSVENKRKPESEVVIDVSWSVSSDLVKNFLRQLKPLLHESKMKVGFFDTSFYGFVEIEREEEIDKMEVPPGGGTDFDVAVEAFSDDAENRIVFTDGEADSPKDDYKDMQVIWIVYGNKNFNPCCGKVIQISEEQLKELSCSIQREDNSR